MRNRNGFMMAELVVVSAIVLGVLATLYVSYNKIYGIYNTRISYYDNTTLYRLAYYRDILIENDLLNDLLKTTKNNTVTNVYSSGYKVFNLPPLEYSDKIEDTVLLVYNGKNTGKKFDYNVLSNRDIHPTFKDYAKFMTNSVTLNSNYVLVMERCNVKENLNIDDCKYAYLEVYDGYE